MHKLDASEADRRVAYDIAKRKFLEGQIKIAEQSLAEGERFVVECNAAIAKLKEDLASVGQEVLPLATGEIVTPENPVPAPGAAEAKQEAGEDAAHAGAQMLEFPDPNPPPLGRT